MSKLHVVLAARPDAKSEFTQAIQTTVRKLGRPFTGFSKIHEVYDDTGAGKMEPVIMPINTTPYVVLNELLNKASNYLDNMTSIESTNTVARGTIKVGSLVITDVPVTILLPLEKEIAKLIPSFESLPTLDGNKQWIPDTQNELPNVWVCPEKTVSYSNKTTTSTEVIAGTMSDRHPAQTHQVDVTTMTGKYTTVNFSSALPASEKRILVDKVKALHNAVVSALGEAKDTEVVEFPIGEVIKNYLLGS